MRALSLSPAELCPGVVVRSKGLNPCSVRLIETEAKRFSSETEAKRFSSETMAKSR
jgi:hypothetical protein